MRWSQTLIPTLREAPREAEIPSHLLMLRAGMMRKVAAGVYSYLPLGWRVIRKVEQIVREEMDRAGAVETLLPTLQPGEQAEMTVEIGVLDGGDEIDAFAEAAQRASGARSEAREA